MLVFILFFLRIDPFANEGRPPTRIQWVWVSAVLIFSDWVMAVMIFFTDRCKLWFFVIGLVFVGLTFLKSDR